MQQIIDRRIQSIYDTASASPKKRRANSDSPKSPFETDRSGIAEVKVLVVVGEFEAGTPLDSSNTEFRGFAAENLPRGIVTGRSQLKGRMLKKPVFPGDFVLEQNLTRVAEIIPPGMRVVTLKCDVSHTLG